MNMSEIPVVNLGPGSQPEEKEGGELDYMRMPSSMSTYTMPSLPEPEDLQGSESAQGLLEDLQQALTGYRVGQPNKRLPVNILDTLNRQLVDQTLGEGEVSILVNDEQGYRIQESVLAGVWRIQQLQGDKADWVEVGAVPGLVSQSSFMDARSLPVFDKSALPPGVFNAPSILVELCDRVSAYKAGDESHVINLTLLPQTPEDLAYLEQCLGVGKTTVLSRGYGNCRITSTQTRNVWWVQYFNADDTLILNTIEVVNVPIVACAAQEDIDDSAERLQEILAVFAE